MRRARIVRVSSAQSLCIFCVCRFALQPGVVQIPRRNLASTRPSTQSASPAADHGSHSSVSASAPSSASASTAFTFDPNSTLTASEQQEKWRRMSAQRKMQEERLAIEAEKQQSKLRNIRDADEKRRSAAAETAEKEKKLEADRRLNTGRTEARRRKDLGSNTGERSFSFGNAPGVRAPTGQSMAQAMMSSRPPEDRRSSEKQFQAARHRTQDRPHKSGGRRESTGGSSSTIHRVLSTVKGPDALPSVKRLDLGSQPLQKPRHDKQKQPDRVAMPEFMLPKQSSSPAAAPTKGWGAQPTDVKPLEYGDVPSNVKDVGYLKSDLQDTRDLPRNGVENARDLPNHAQPLKSHKRRVSFSGTDEQSSAPETVNVDAGGSRESAPLQQESQSHTFKPDSSVYSENRLFERQPNEPSSNPGAKPMHVPNQQSQGITRDATKAAAFGGSGRFVAEESLPAATWESGPDAAEPSLSSIASIASSTTPVEQPGKTSHVSTDLSPNTNDLASPANNTVPYTEQTPDLPHGTGVQPRDQPVSPQQEMIEKMRRMVEEFDRTNNLNSAVSSSASSKPEPEQSARLHSSPPAQSHLFGQSSGSSISDSPSTTTAPKSTATAYENFANPISQRRLGDTGYRATPFDPDEMLQSSQAPAQDEGKWGLLRRQQDTPSAQSPRAPSPEPFPQPSVQPRWTLSRAREEDADKLFEAHRATRTSYAPPVSTHSESDSFDRTYSNQDLSNKICGRCGQLGHTAGMCQGPVRSQSRRERPSFQVFVGGVSLDASMADFQAYFANFEDVVGSNLVTHYAGTPGIAGRSRGFGFVSFDTEQARQRFITKGPFTLLGKQMKVTLDQGSTRDRPGQNSATIPDRHSNRSRITNPFDAAESENGADVIRRTSSETNFDENDSRNAPTPPKWPVDDFDRSEEKSRGFRQAEPLAVAAEDPRRGREARRRQWEEPEADAENSDRGIERKGRRGSRREIEEDEEDERGGAREAHRARKAARQRQKDAEKEAEKQAAKRKRDMKKKDIGTPITLPEFISVQHLSQALGVRYEAFVERLEELGYDDVFAGKTLDSETSGMIAMEYNFDPSFDGGYREEEVRDLKARPPLMDRDSLPARPPVVTIMGHVDHGKTTILDYLRNSSVAAGEAGGITQHIGAFSVPLAASGKTVTFLDTPGHAAFLAMRQRGANVTDMVILVVAADDSVKPQTLEAIKHAKEAGVPMIVALNKVDKPEADVERCKQDLARHGVEIEDYGGDVQVVEVSGKTGKGMDALEENVVALSELLDHRAETDGAVEGWVLEATTRKAGRVATVLVRRGTLVPGAVIVAGKTWARVRTLRNEAGVELKEGGPGMPCEVDGWRDQPFAGDEVLEAPTEQKAGSVVEFRIELAEREQAKRDMEVINTNRKLEQERREREKAAEQAAKRAAAAAATVGPDGSPIPALAPDTTAASAKETEIEKESGQLKIPFLIKADVSGSAEAVAAYILSLSSPLIAPSILASGVGPVHESDIELASAAEGHIIAFNLPNNPEAMGNATAKGVKILANDIIYRCLDDVRAVLEEKLPPIITSRVTGEADISAKFEIGVGGRKKMAIAGVKVRNGIVTRNARVRVLRGGEKVYDGTISSLKNQKKDADVMRKGTECGMGFADWENFEAGDQVQVYEEISEKRRL